MASDVLGISVTGLRVSQNALRTSGHNIANANTQGYSSQSTEINTLGASPSGAGYIGNGAYTSRIERIVNDFVTGQVRQDTSLYGEFSAYNEHVLQLNDVLSNSSTGLTQGLESFFSAIQNATGDPTSTSARQLVISEAENLANRFNTLYNRIDTISNSVEQNLEAAVDKINTLTSSIARLNRSISESFSSSASNPPNDLLDQRDEALRQLSELVTVQVTEQGDVVNVAVGNGISLVVGSTTSTLRLGQNEYNPLESEIYITGLTQPIGASLAGGEMGGLLDVQETVIRPAFNDLGRVALVIADSFNELQQQGITLTNSFGTNLFQDVNDSAIVSNRVFPSTNNATSNQLVSLSITDSSQLTTSDYRLLIGGGSTTYRVERLADGVEVASGTVPGAFPASIEFDGISFDIAAGTFTSGDEFLIQPTRFGAQHFSVLALQPEDIALGSPVLTDTSLGNLGNGEISAGEVLSLLDSNGVALPLLAQVGQMSPSLLIQFTTPTSYDILDNSDPGNPIQLDPPIRNQSYVPGIQNNLFASDSGQTTVVSNGTALGLPAGSTEVPAGTAVNNYAADTFTFTTTNPDTGATSSQTVFSTLNASARATAGVLDNISGVSATAFNYLELRDFSVSLTSPLQITLNGEDLVDYSSGAIATTVPDPTVNSGEDFNDYLVDKINSNSNLTNLGIYAVSAYDAVAAEFYIQVHSTRGDDLTVQLEAAVGEVIDVNDGTNADVTMTGAGAGTVTEVLVGGQIDVTLASNIAMTTAGTDIFNAAVAQASYLGIQAKITGTPQSGDTFSIDFNTDAALDSRNGLAMIALQQSRTMAGGQETYSSAYNRLVETVGIKANSSQLNTESAKNILAQTISLRDSVSGVNLDEEAADLIRFEQLYSANAQVINVARDLFDRLLSSF